MLIYEESGMLNVTLKFSCCAFEVDIVTLSFLSTLIKVLVAGTAWYCMGQTKPCHSRCWLWSCQLWRLHVWQRCAYHVFCSKRWAWSSSTICTRKGNSSNISCNGHQETSIPQQGLWCHPLRPLQGPLAHWRSVLLVTCLPFFYQFSVEVNLVADSCCFQVACFYWNWTAFYALVVTLSGLPLLFTKNSQRTSRFGMVLQLLLPYFTQTGCNFLMSTYQKSVLSFCKNTIHK